MVGSTARSAPGVTTTPDQVGSHAELCQSPQQKGCRQVGPPRKFLRGVAVPQQVGLGHFGSRNKAIVLFLHNLELIVFQCDFEHIAWAETISGVASGIFIVIRAGLGTMRLTVTSRNVYANCPAPQIVLLASGRRFQDGVGQGTTVTKRVEHIAEVPGEPEHRGPLPHRLGLPGRIRPRCRREGTGRGRCTL